MAIQPRPKSDGSVHVLRFVGNIVLAADVEAPGNAELVAAPAANAAATVRFYLCDLTSLTDEKRRFPPSVLDDTMPAGSSPHDPNVEGGPVQGGNPGGMTWSQSLQVRVQETEVPHAALIARVDTLMPHSAYDVANNQPYVDLDFYFTAAGAALVATAQDAGVPVVVEFESPFTAIR